MKPPKPGQQAQTQSAPQAQSGYKKPSQSSSGAGAPIPPQSEPPLLNRSDSASSSVPMDKHKKMMAVAALVFGLAVGAYWISGGKDPEPSQAEIDARTQQYQQGLAQVGGVIGLPVVKESELKEALATISSDQDRQKLATQVQQKQTTLVWVTLWDTAAEDGDVVRVTSDGFSQEVLIRHNPTKVAVPLPSSGTVAVTGSYDGGGGITLGILSNSSKILMPYVRVGQVINVPVSAMP